MEFSNQYLTWTEYQSLDGTLTQSAFNLLEYDARKQVDRLTFGRLVGLATQKQETKLCVFKLIGVINENKSSIKSESIDGYSITLMDKKDLNRLYSNVIEEYLGECRLDDGTPYLYRG